MYWQSYKLNDDITSFMPLCDDTNCDQARFTCRSFNALKPGRYRYDCIGSWPATHGIKTLFCIINIMHAIPTAHATRVPVLIKSHLEISYMTLYGLAVQACNWVYMYMYTVAIVTVE